MLKMLSVYKTVLWSD